MFDLSPQLGRAPECSPALTHPSPNPWLPQVNALLASERDASDRLRTEAARTKDELIRALEVSAGLEREVNSLWGTVRRGL